MGQLIMSQGEGEMEKGVKRGVGRGVGMGWGRVVRGMGERSGRNEESRKVKEEGRSTYVHIGE